MEVQLDPVGADDIEVGIQRKSDVLQHVGNRTCFADFSILHIFAGESPGQAGVINAEAKGEAGADILAHTYSQRERHSIDRFARLHDSVALGTRSQAYYTTVE